MTAIGKISWSASEKARSLNLLRLALILTIFICFCNRNNADFRRHAALLTGYAARYNRRHRHTGTLSEPFQVVLCRKISTGTGLHPRTAARRRHDLKSSMNILLRARQIGGQL
jgi:hypothetical protein